MFRADYAIKNTNYAINNVNYVIFLIYFKLVLKGFRIRKTLFCFPKTGLLIGCGKKREILRHFQGEICGKKGPLRGKLCDFFKADLTLFY